MVILIVNHIKSIVINAKVFPFISLTLTPLVVLHVFTLDLKLTEVVKLQIKHLFRTLTYDLFDIKSHMSGKELEKPGLLLVGY